MRITSFFSLYLENVYGPAEYISRPVLHTSSSRHVARACLRPKCECKLRHIHSLVRTAGRLIEMCDIRVQMIRNQSEATVLIDDMTLFYAVINYIVCYHQWTTNRLCTLSHNSRKSIKLLRCNYNEPWGVSWLDEEKRGDISSSLCLHLVAGQSNSCSNAYGSLDLRRVCLEFLTRLWKDKKLKSQKYKQSLKSGFRSECSHANVVPWVMFCCPLHKKCLKYNI